MTQPTLSNNFKSAVECFIEGSVGNSHDIHTVMSTLVEHGFVENEFGAGSKTDPCVLDIVENEIKNQLLEKLLVE